MYVADGPELLSAHYSIITLNMCDWTVSSICLVSLQRELFFEGCVTNPAPGLHLIAPGLSGSTQWPCTYTVGGRHARLVLRTDFSLDVSVTAQTSCEMRTLVVNRDQDQSPAMIGRGHP